MPRRLLFINVVLAAVSVLSLVLIVKQLLTARPAVALTTDPVPAPTKAAADRS